MYSGLGLDAAKLLARLNCSTIVLVCRSLEKCDQAKREILGTLSKSMQSKLEVVTLTLDMGSFQSLADCAEQCKSLPRLDAVILNAGVHLEKFSLAAGYETTMTINVISTFLFASLLLPQLRATARKHSTTPNIAIVGSAVHFWCDPAQLTGPVEGNILKSLSEEKTAVMKDRYYLSKLPVMLLVRYLAKLLERSAASDPTGKPLVIINNVAPGFCKTNLFRQMDLNVGMKAGMAIIGRSSEHGARTLVHGAVAGKESHGQYLSECRVKKASPFVRSTEGDATAEKIWKELAVIYEKVQPGCSSAW